MQEFIYDTIIHGTKWQHFKEGNTKLRGGNNYHSPVLQYEQASNDAQLRDVITRKY